MKKLLLASAVAALSVSAAQAAPTIYGKAFVTADYVNADVDYDGGEYTYIVKDKNGVEKEVTLKDSDSNSLQINSNGSRFGFKGAEPMTADTDVIYQMEFGLDVDDGDKVKLRDTYLGARSKNFGEVRVGKNTSVLDYVNNVTVTQAFWSNLGNPKTDPAVVDAYNMVDSDRTDNSVIWKTPNFTGMPVELAVMYAADEEFYNDKDDRDNGFGASAMFDQGTGFTAGVAYTKDIDAAGDVVRGTVSYDASAMMGMPLTVGALYQVADYDYNDAEEENGLVISGEMGLEGFARPASIYAQYNMTENLNGLDNADSDQIVVGGKYKYKNNMIMHGYVGNNATDIGNDDVNVFAVGGGLEYKF